MAKERPPFTIPTQCASSSLFLRLCVEHEQVQQSTAFSFTSPILTGPSTRPARPAWARLASLEPEPSETLDGALAPHPLSYKQLSGLGL